MDHIALLPWALQHGTGNNLAPTKFMSLVSWLSDCVEAVKVWMTSSQLCLNSPMTELIWLGASRYVQLCLISPLYIAGVSIRPSRHVHNLGVVIDSELSLAAHISPITSVCYFQIQQIWLLRRPLSFKRLMLSCMHLFTPDLTIVMLFLAMLRSHYWLLSSPFSALLLVLY